MLLFLSLGMTACIKEEQYPIEPVINFEQFATARGSDGKDSLGVLSISYTDGDGDLGYPAIKPDPQYDLYISYFEMNNGVLENVTTPSGDTIQFNARLPYLTPDIANKTIKGEIEDTLTINNPLSDNDTILFRIYLVDRANNKSNTIETPLIKIIKR